MRKCAALESQCRAGHWRKYHLRREKCRVQRISNDRSGTVLATRYARRIFAKRR